ncbi:putative sigma54 specific transcriptional regulator with PAS/PAC sensor [Pseudodesulfovibrio mercurii]|uniref:Putative sigma54 specific transcriptional regulator with PAS/PAC sensor n=1 Tax=Pseudodesulfovibrio mercurii TaxID=641491 RepID=F0JCK3_9BACT|nr:sigma 54-interacting transcriptional regulator [Pseudodesulfovibrio mercurii]EGB15683.1 putative sigma54 specific transcriptional regulator with PAS/PAC sensor [Pseudodesulfovibrio mercurii]
MIRTGTNEARLFRNPSPVKAMIGECAAMERVRDFAKVAALSDRPVLIHGESGTGKELLADHIRSLSRYGGRIVRLNCADFTDALFSSELFGHDKGAYTGADRATDGLVKAADGGCLFLDEIGEMPLSQQPRLLRFLQDGSYRRVGGTQTFQADLKVILATNRDLRALVEEGRFREDLFYRISVHEMCLPPLRERGEGDIRALARHFLKFQCEKMDIDGMAISEDALEALAGHDWPGNIRELENVMAAAFDWALHEGDDRIGTRYLKICPDFLGRPSATATKLIDALLRDTERALAVLREQATPAEVETMIQGIEPSRADADSNALWKRYLSLRKITEEGLRGEDRLRLIASARSHLAHQGNLSWRHVGLILGNNAQALRRCWASGKRKIGR